MKCNVMYVSNEATLGGAAQSLIDMLKALQYKFIKPIVVIPNHGIIEERLQELGVVYYVVPFSNCYGPIGMNTPEIEDAIFRDNYCAALQLQDIINQENINLVHINSGVNNVGALAALIAGIPYVWHFREFLEEDFDCEFWDKELKMQLIRYAGSIITISNSVAEWYKHKYDIDSTCIYNGIDIEKYKNNLRITNYDLKEHRFIITGAITKNKGQFDAVKAIEALVAEGIVNIHLDLLGHGPGRFRWFLKQYVQNNGLEEFVAISSFQKNLSDYRKKNQYALTTSKMEALGRCTIEAMLAGQIVIGADTGGTKEIIGMDETRGYLYKQGDYRSLAETMKRVLSESDERKKSCRENAQIYAEDMFSLGKYADSIYSLYKQVLEENLAKNKHNVKKFLKELSIRYDCKSDSIKATVSNEGNYNVILNNWSKLADNGESISNYLQNHNYKKIAVYGMGKLGCRLYEELVMGGIEISYVIDQNQEFLEGLVVVKQPDEKPEEVDIIIVAVSREEQEIVRNYRERFNCKIIGISELLEQAVRCY